MPRAGWVKPETNQRLSDHISIGVLTRVFPPELVDRIVEETGRKELRHRLLPTRVVVYYVLGLALFADASYQEVMRNFVAGLSWASGWERAWRVPSKERAGMEHCPSASFWAHAAWIQCAVLAHNLVRWTQVLGGLRECKHRPAVARTIRTRFVSMPGRLVNRSGTPTLRVASHWPWQQPFTSALEKLRALLVAVT